MSTENEVIYSIIIDRFHPGHEEMNVTSYRNDKWFNPAQRCGGTIKGIIQQLSYIKKLGCTSILLNPFLKNNPESYHGYSIMDFLELDSDWGTLQDIVSLVDSAHELDLKVYFDAVLNHTGNNWVYKVNQPRYQADIFYSFDHWRYQDYPKPISLRNINLYSRKGAIINWEDSKESKDGDIFDLKDLNTNLSSLAGKETLSIMTDIYSYWMVKTNCDGYRIDAAKHIHADWLNQWIKEIKARALSQGKTDFFIFGEYISNDLDWVNEYALDGAFDFPLYFIWRTHASLSNDKIIRNYSSSYQWIRFLDNHDQVGLEPKARLAALWPKEHIRLVWALLLLSPGIPCIYYGSEQWAFGEGIHDGYIREPMFAQDKNTSYLNETSNSYRFMQEILKIRVQLTSILNAKWEQVEIDKSEKIWNFIWHANGKYLIICLNMSDKVVDLFIENRIFHIKDAKKSVYLYDGEEWIEQKNNSLVSPHQMAWSWVIYEKY